MNNKKKNEGRTDFSYYGLYLLDYLTTNKFEQAADEAFIRERTDRAAMFSVFAQSIWKVLICCWMKLRLPVRLIL